MFGKQRKGTEIAHRFVEGDGPPDRGEVVQVNRLVERHHEASSAGMETSLSV